MHPDPARGSVGDPEGRSCRQDLIHQDLLVTRHGQADPIAHSIDLQVQELSLEVHPVEGHALPP